MKRTAIYNIGNDNCCGCFLCSDVCGYQAISMKLNEEGFYKPYVNENVCTDCGLCNKVCPIASNSHKNSPFEKPKVLGGWSLHDNVRQKSSSGGVFFELASHFINCGGKVCGVKWQDCKPIFDIVSTIEELKAFMGSKYLQADATDIYKKVKAFIKDKERVLFAGLPCQVQAISNYINSDNLFLIDVVCAGVPSMKMFETYCLETFPNEKVAYVNFRSKRADFFDREPAPWRKFSVDFHSTEYLLLSEKHCQNQFFQAFNSTKCYNTSCYSCSFNTVPRRGNITLCDFWGATGDKEKKDGTSLILLNDEHGVQLFDNFVQSHPSSLYIEEVSLEEAQNGTKRLNMPQRLLPQERKAIFKKLQKSGFKAMYRKYFYRSFKKRFFEHGLLLLKKIRVIVSR